MGTPKKQSTVGTGLALGGRQSQQDLILNQANLFSINNVPVHVFGIFDGHGIFRIYKEHMEIGQRQKC